MEFLMEFLDLWLVTIIASFCMEIANELRMFKDIADAGYKIDVKRISELREHLNPNAIKATRLSLLTPIINVMQVFQRTIQYNNARSMILDQLSVIDVLQEMSEIEKTEYLKNPTGLNALIVQLKLETRLPKETSVEINNGNEHSEIDYKMGESIDDITDLSDSKEDKKEEEITPQSAQELSISEQKQALEDLKSELLEEHKLGSHEPKLTKKI